MLLKVAVQSHHWPQQLSLVTRNQDVSLVLSYLQIFFPPQLSHSLPSVGFWNWMITREGVGLVQKTVNFVNFLPWFWKAFPLSQKHGFPKEEPAPRNVGQTQMTQILGSKQNKDNKTL